MATYFYSKEGYIKNCKAQSEVCSFMLKSLNVLSENLPANGKRFNLKKMQELMPEDIRVSSEYGRIRLALCSSKYPYYDGYKDEEIKSNTDYRNTETAYLESGIVRNYDGIKNKIAECIKKWTAIKERNDNAPDLIDGYIEKFKAFEKAWNELREYTRDMPNITAGVIQDCMIR